MLLLAAVLMTAGIADAQTKVKTGFNLFTPTQDVEVGTASAAEADKQLPIVKDRMVDAYVDEIGQRLAEHAGGPAFKYQFSVVNSSEINAFALPGGFVYVNRGILENAKNEGEVAGVIAHEIAHVSLRHGTHQASKAYGAQAGLSILGGLLGDNVGQNTAGIINAVGGVGLNVLFLKFTRDLESQADVRGAQILAASGYSPADMISFFRSLEQANTPSKTSWLSSHPSPPDRIARIEQEAKLLRVTSQPTQGVAELHGIQSRLQRLGAAPNATQIAALQPGNDTGGTTGTQTSTTIALPSTSMRTFTSKSRVYRISYPDNWTAREQGTTGVVIAPAGGIARSGNQSDVVYGAIVAHYEPFGNESNGKSLGYLGDVSSEDATTDLIQQLMKDDTYLKLVNNSTQTLELESGTANVAVLRGVNPRTNAKERVTLVTHRLSDDDLIYLLFITPEKEAARYSPTLKAMVNSIEFDDEHTH
jgi:hypothetical protein